MKVLPRSFPLPTGTAEQCARLRELLIALGYTPASLAERTGSSIMDDRPDARDPRGDGDPRDGLDVVIRLFWLSEAVPRSAMFQLLPADAWELLEGIGLVQHDPESDMCSAWFALYPVGSLFIVSDQLQSVLQDNAPADVVYPALTGSTVEFLSALPSTPCASLLDLGCGTGIAALAAAAGCAGHAWAVDIAARSTRFTEFNALLNGIANVTVLQGDVYGPVAGQTFDRIVAHPPFMPKLQATLIFADGGEDGEQITRRVVAGLGDHLRPGGRLYCRCLATDRKDAPLEQRVREMLGAAAPHFDVLVLARKTMPATQFFCQLLARGEVSAEAYAKQMGVYADLGVENLVLCTVVIERHAEPRQPLDIRRELAPRVEPQPELADWLFRWERAAGDPGAAAKMLPATPVASKHAEIRLAHHMDRGELRAHGCTVTTRFPFSFTFESSPGLALLLGRCDGTRTVAALLDELKQIGALPLDTEVENFLHLVRRLVGGGALEIPEHQLPQPPERYARS